MGLPGLPPTAKIAEFDIVEEHWSEYEAESGDVVIRARNVAQHLIDVDGGKNWGVNGQAIVVVSAQRESMRGKPNLQLGEDLASARKFPVDFTAIREPWNVYRTRGPNPMLIKTRLVVTSVERIPDKFDNLGEPIYSVSHNTVIAPPIPDRTSATR